MYTNDPAAGGGALNITRHELPNGYVVGLFPRTEHTVDEIWTGRCYDVPIRRGDVVIDLGANQGVFSLYAAAQGARVIAVEPDEANYRRLVENIEQNGLSGRITAHRAAVTARDGAVDLFVPETEDYCDSGLITTEESILNSYGALEPRRVRKLSVPAMTLQTLLDRIPALRVAVLKIDCEGAELAILRSAGPGGHARVDRLVMETHQAYPERELFFAVQELGYTVTSYRRRARGVAGVFATGHLAAERAALPAEGFQGTVAVLDAPRTVRTGSTLTLGAEPSFSAASPRAELQFRWSVDGQPLGDAASVRYTARSSGDRVLSLTVEDPTTGRRDSVTHHLWAFTGEYGRAAGEVELLAGASEPLRTRFVPEGTWYGLREEQLPSQLRSGLWKPDRVALELTLTDPQGSAGAEVTLRIDDRVIRLEAPHTRIDLAHYPVGEGLLFRVEASRPVEAEVRWFAEVAAEPEWLAPGPDRHDLPERSRTYVGRVSGRTGFRIPAWVMPVDWTPQRVTIGLSVHDVARTGRELEGEVQVNGESHPLSGRYTEVTLTRPEEFARGVSFEVIVGAPRIYRLVWWWE